jgi:hypothetical protein
MRGVRVFHNANDARRNQPNFSQARNENQNEVEEVNAGRTDSPGAVEISVDTETLGVSGALGAAFRCFASDRRDRKKSASSAA